MQFIKIVFQQRKIFITLFCLISILLNIRGYAQEEKGFTFGDSLFKKMSVDDLIQIRKYYDSKVGKLRSEEEASRGEGMTLSESFLGERGEHISNRDKVYIRIAEYYIEESELENDAAVEKYDKKMDKYDGALALYENGELESEPVMPEYPTYDYSKAINIYERLLDEYPSSKFASDALYCKAWLLSKMKKDKESRRVYQEVIDKYPDSPFAPESYIQLAEYFFAPRDDKTEDEQVIVELQKAIKLYKKVIKYRDSKRYDEALYKLGWSYYKLAARDPGYYNDAITYFMAVADDITRAKKLDPRNKITNPNVRDEAIEYIGISLTDETYTKNGVDKARNLIERIGGCEYGGEIIRAIGQTFQKIDEQNKAIYAFSTLLDMYPNYEEAPQIQHKIVNGLYALGKDNEAYQARKDLYERYNPQTEWYAFIENSTSDDRIKHINSAYKLTEAALRTNILIDLEKAEELASTNMPSTEQYEIFAEDCQLYLSLFTADSNAYDINWSYAFMLDSRLSRFEEAYEEYIKVSNDYLETSHRHDAALNAVGVADTLVAIKYGSAEDTVKINLADIAQLSPEALTPEETRVIESYDNYIRLFPTGKYTPNFLAAAGGIYYNHKKFAEAKVYFQTLVKRFPGAEEKSLAMRSIMDSYFALGKFKDSEIIAKKIMSDANISEEQRQFAEKRLGQAVFKNAEYLEEQGDYFAAANEFVRVYKEASSDKLLVETSLYRAGLNFQKAKDWVRAVETFDIIVTEFSDSKFAIDALENMADDYKELEQYVKSAQTYERVYTNYRDSKNAEPALYNASFFYKKGEDWANAIRVNDIYVSTYPDEAFAIDLFFSNADLYLKMDNIVEANKIYEEFSRRYPDDPRTVTAFYERGKYYLESGQEELAKSELNKAIEKSESFRKQGKDPNAFIAGEAVNTLAGILHKEFLAIELKQPQSNIEYQKERMRTTLGELNKTYSKVIGFGSQRSFEATYNIARSYEEFANTFSAQEINPNLTDDKKFIERKRINEQSAELYENAVTQYKTVIEKIPEIAQKFEIDMFALTAETEAETTEAFPDSAEGVSRIVEKDSTQELAIKWHEKAKDKVSELLYTKANLTSENVYQAVSLKSNTGSPIKDILYKIQVLQKIATPAIQQTIDSHIRNIKEAEALGLSNKYVEESKRQILLTSNIKGEELENLTRVTLREYKVICNEIADLVEKEFEAVNARGEDYYVLDNNAAQMLDFSKILSQEVLKTYTSTLVLAEENNIQNDLIRNTEDRALRFTIQITNEMEVYADSANNRSVYYGVRFDSTENYNYEDAKGFFENYYYAFNDNSKEILDQAFEIREQYEIKSLWANKLLLKLIKIDPTSYAASIEKDKVVVSSDESWVYSTTYYEGQWTKPDFDDSGWQRVQVKESYDNQFAGLGVNPDAIGARHEVFVDTAGAPDSFMSDGLSTDSLGQVETDSMLTEEIIDAGQDSLTTDIVDITIPVDDDTQADTLLFFRKSFEVDGTPVSGEMYVTADNDFRLYLNGEYIIDDELDNYSVLDTLDYYTFDVFLKKGKNVISIDVEDKDLSAGGLKFYAFTEILPSDITAAAEEKAKVKKVIVDSEILRKVNILNKNRISVNQ